MCTCISTLATTYLRTRRPYIHVVAKIYVCSERARLPYRFSFPLVIGFVGRLAEKGKKSGRPVGIEVAPEGCQGREEEAER